MGKFALISVFLDNFEGNLSLNFFLNVLRTKKLDFLMKFQKFFVKFIFKGRSVDLKELKWTISEFPANFKQNLSLQVDR